MFENHQTDARTKPLPDVSPTMGSERNAQPSNNNPLVVTQCGADLAGTLRAEVAPTLAAQPSALEPTVVGLDLYSQSETGGVSMTVTAAASDPHHIPCVCMEDAAVALAIRTAQTGANGCGISDEAAHTLDRAEGQAVAELAGDYVVRRLTPRECERLQGFPDDWTRIPYRGKPAEECPDGPRYKAMGNSWGTNCAEWILRRLLAARTVWHPEPDEPSTTERIP